MSFLKKPFVKDSNKLSELKRYEDPEVCDQAIGFQSEDALAWNNKGISLYNLGRYVELLKHTTRR